MNSLSGVLLLAGNLVIALFCCEAAHAKFVYSFESSLEGWGPSGFGTGASQNVQLSAIGATQGSTQSMQLGHVKQSVFPQSFSWDASVVLNAGSSAYAALSNAYSAPAGKLLELDYTWDEFLLPSTGWTFGNISVSIQDDVAFRQIDSLALINFGDPLPAEAGLSLPLDSGGLAGGIPDSSFYRITIGINVDAGADAAVGGFVDNLTITPEPPGSWLLGLLSVWLGGLRHRR